jgi:hypothetical protein
MKSRRGENTEKNRGSLKKGRRRLDGGKLREKRVSARTRGTREGGTDPEDEVGDNSGEEGEAEDGRTCKCAKSANVVSLRFIEREKGRKGGAPNRSS